jgi:hypothetical protein
VIHIIVTFISSNRCLIFSYLLEKSSCLKHPTQTVISCVHYHVLCTILMRQSDLLSCCFVRLQLPVKIISCCVDNLKKKAVLHINLNSPMMNSHLLSTPQLGYMYMYYPAIILPSAVVFDFVCSCGFCELGLYIFQLTTCPAWAEWLRGSKN